MHPVYVLTDKLVYKCHYFRITLIRDWCSLVLPLFSRYEEKKLCCGFTAQSTQWGHIERGQFT